MRWRDQPCCPLGVCQQISTFTSFERESVQKDKKFIKGRVLYALARRSRDGYANEQEAEILFESLRSRIQKEMVTTDIPIVSGLGIYPALFLLFLIAEWILRRRLNLL